MLVLPEGIPTRISSCANIDRNHLTKKTLFSAWLHIDFHRRHLGIRTWQVQNQACFGTAGALKHRSLKTQLPYLALYVAPHYLVTNPRCVVGSCFFFQFDSWWTVVGFASTSSKELWKPQKLTTLRFFHLKITRWSAHLPRWASPWVESKGLTDLYMTHPYWFAKRPMFSNICLSQVSKFLGRE